MYSCKEVKKPLRYALRRIMSVLLALSVVVGGVPAMTWSALTGIFPSLADYEVGNEVYAAPGDVKDSKTAEWIPIPGREDEATARVTLSVSGEPINASSDVVVLLDRGNMMYANWCMNEEHYTEVPLEPINATYYVTESIGGEHSVTDWLTIKMIVHKAVYPKSTVLCGLSIKGYSTEYLGRTITSYRMTAGKSWGVNDWKNVEKFSMQTENLRDFIVKIIKESTSYDPSQFSFLDDIPDTIQKMDGAYSSECHNGYEAGVKAAKNLAETLLTETENGSSVPNNIALLTFNASRRPALNEQFVNLDIEFGSTLNASLNAWRNFNANKYPTQQPFGYARYRMALHAAKYYLAKKTNHYELRDSSNNVIPLDDYNMNSDAFNNLIGDLGNNTLKTDLDRGKLYPKIPTTPGDKPYAPYIIVISSLAELGPSFDTKDINYIGLTVDTSGLVIHGVGLVENSFKEYTDSLMKITEGKATDRYGEPISTMYPGHYVNNVFNPMYKGDFYRILTGADLTEAFLRIPKSLRFAGYDAKIIDKIGAGFDFDEGQHIEKTAGNVTVSLDKREITWELDVITAAGASMSYGVVAKAPSDPNKGTIAESVLKNQGDLTGLNTNLSATLEYKDPTGADQPKRQFKKPRLPVKQIVYTVEYYKSDDFKKPVDTVTVTGYTTPLNPYLPLDPSLIDKDKYKPDYSFIEDSLVAIPDIMGDGYVIKLYYQKDEVKEITYEVHYYFDGVLDPTKTETITVPVFNDDDTVPVDDSLFPTYKNGYKRLTKPDQIPKEAKDGDVIRVDYISEPQTFWTLDYKIQYYVRDIGLIKTEEVKVDLPTGTDKAILRQDLILSEIEHQNVLYDLDDRTGIPDPTDPIAFKKPPQEIEDGIIIKLYYIPGSKTVRYTVEYIKCNNPGDVGTLADSHHVSLQIPSNQNTFLVNEDYISKSLNENKYPGYTWDTTRNSNVNPTTPYGDKAVIKLYYNKNNEIKDFSFWIEYYKGGGPGDDPNTPVEKIYITLPDKWAGMEDYKVPNNDEYFPTDKYPGYTMDPAKDIFPIDNNGIVTIPRGGTVKVYYWGPGTSNGVPYEVWYIKQNKDGTYPTVKPPDFATGTTSKLDANGFGLVDAKLTTGPVIIEKFKNLGYVYSPLQVVPTMVKAAPDNIIKIYYDIDYKTSPEPVEFTVKYFLSKKGVTPTTPYKIVVVNRDVWIGFTVDSAGNPISPIPVEFDKAYYCDPNMFNKGDLPYLFDKIKYNNVIKSYNDMPVEIDDGSIVEVYYVNGTITFQIHYFKDGVRDVPATKTVTVVADDDGKYTITPDDEDEFFNNDKFPGYELDLDLTDIPDKVKDNDIIEVHYKSLTGTVPLTIVKDLVDETGALINSTSNQVFKVFIYSGTGGALDFRKEVLLQPGDRKIEYVPKRLLSIKEDLSTLNNEYMLEEILTSGNRPADKVGNELIGKIDMSNRTSGNVSVVNARKLATPPPKVVPEGEIWVSKYVYQDGLMVNDTNIFTVILSKNGVVEQTKPIKHNETIKFVVDIDTDYVITETTSDNNYSIIGIYDADKQGAAQGRLESLVARARTGYNGFNAVILNARHGPPIIVDRYVTYTVEYYLDGKIDRDTSKTYTKPTTNPDGKLTINPNDYVVPTKYEPYYQFQNAEYLSQPSATPAGVPNNVENGSIIRVYYQLKPIQSPVKINLYKLLINDNSQRITAAKDNTVFEVVINGENGFKSIHYLANEATMTVDVPANSVYTISEYIAGTPNEGKYFLREVVVSGNGLNGVLDMRNRTTGNATLINVKIRKPNDPIDPNDPEIPPQIPAGYIYVTKYVFTDGVENRSVNGTFEAILYSGRADGTKIAELQRRVMIPRSVNLPFNPGAGTYIIEEAQPMQVGFTLIGIYDGNISNEKAKSAVTVTLQNDQRGKSILILNSYTDPAPPINPVKITLIKLLLDHNSQRITNDSTDFLVTVTGDSGYKTTVSLKNEQSKVIDVPRDRYTISEYIAGTSLEGKYILREVVVSGNGLNGILDMRNRTTGNATVINVRLKRPDDPELPAGAIYVTKYIFTDGIENRSATGSFTAILNGTKADQTKIAEERRTMGPRTANVPFNPGAGTYTITELQPMPAGFSLIGIYDGNINTQKAQNSVTVELKAGQPGKSILILNAYLEGPRPSSTPPPYYPPASSRPSSGPGPLPTATPIVIIPSPTAPLAGFIADHIQYINGYPDGSVRPDAPITRAETSAIIFRLLVDTRKHNTYKSAFSDVTDTAWYSQSVKYLTSINIVKGYPDGTFKPDNPITRAEFATMISGFDKLEPSKDNNFKDIDGHWAVGYINSAAVKGWVAGYPDGTFHPNGKLTRAEIVTVINRMLIRKVLLEDLPRWIPNYNDIDSTHWGYVNIMEASVGHEFKRKDEIDLYEKWTRKMAWAPVLES